MSSIIRIVQEHYTSNDVSQLHYFGVVEELQYIS